MTITIKEVIEQCAREADAFNDGFSTGDAQHISEAIRALAEQYEGCIVAEGNPQYHGLVGTLYKAREAK